jgi:hypothetical protein
MDDFPGKAVPLAIADETLQGRKHGQPQSSPSRIFDWINAAAARGRGAIATPSWPRFRGTPLLKVGATAGAPRTEILVKRYGPPAALTVCLFGLAWVGWSNIQRPAPTMPSAEINLPAQKTTEESHAQRAEVEAKRAAQSLDTEEVRAETAKPSLEAAKNEASPGIVEAADKTSRLPAKPVEKLAKGGERVDRIGLKIAALLAVDPLVDHSVSATPARKRNKALAAAPSVRRNIPTHR